MKYLILILLLMFSAPAMSASNVYYNKDAVGEGITLYEYVDLFGDENRLFYFYTYGAGEDGQQNQWYVGNDLVQKGDETVGKLYTTEGVDYPFGVPCAEPFENCVGELILVGYYVMRPNPKDEGYQLWVAPPEEDDEKEDFKLADDWLYERTFTFDVPLLNDVIVDSGVAPK